ncbi:MAG: hypothetical protein E7175_03825 [Erysipelotrichaceae bacterium]|nr:hypothetical protein [Erysipelotrichaceae bacterium]
MSVKWISKIDTTGTATIYQNYIQTNKQFVDKFIDKYSVLVGLDDETDTIYLKPLSLDEDNDVKYQSSLKIKFNIQKSFMRFGNTKNISQIASIIHVEIPKAGLRGISKWDEKENSLVICFGGEK